MTEFNQIPDPEEDKRKDLESSQDPDEQNSHHKIFPKISPISAAFLGLIGGFFLYQFVGGVITILVLGMDIKNAPVNSVRLMTIAGQMLFILLPALIFAKFVYEDVTEIIRFKKTTFIEILIFLTGILVLTPLLQYYIAIQTYVINHLAQQYSFVHYIKSILDKVDNLVNQSYGELLSAHSVFEGLLVIIVVAVTPAICEETMFRGFIQRSFEFKMKPAYAILITAVFFAGFHFNPYATIPLIILGAYFGFAVYKSDSIFVSMSMHFTNNLIAIISFFILGNDDLINTNPGANADMSTTVSLFLLFLALFVGVILLINNYYSKKQKA